MDLHEQPQIHHGRDFPIERVALDLSANAGGGVAQQTQTICYGGHGLGWRGRIARPRCARRILRTIDFSRAARTIVSEPQKSASSDWQELLAARQLKLRQFAASIRSASLLLIFNRAPEMNDVSTAAFEPN